MGLNLCLGRKHNVTEPEGRPNNSTCSKTKHLTPPCWNARGAVLPVEGTPGTTPSPGPRRGKVSTPGRTGENTSSSVQAQPNTEG